MAAIENEPPRGTGSNQPHILAREELRVLLAGAEPELKKVPPSFSLVDPVVFELATTAPEGITRLQNGGARLLVVDLLLSEDGLAQLVQTARSRGVRTIVAVSRRDTPPLRRRAERLAVDVAVFVRRPRNVVIEVIRNTIQYEIRRTPRAVLAARVRMVVEGSSHESEGINVSAGGLLVQLSRPVSVGALANISFDLPGRGHRIIATARTVRSEQYVDGYLTGLQFEVISEADRQQIAAYTRRTLEPPDTKLDPLQRARQASRTCAFEVATLRATISGDNGLRRDHLRIRDLSSAGVFLYPKPVFEHPWQAGQNVEILIRGPASSLRIKGRVQRSVLRASLEAQLFPNGFAVEFTADRPSDDDIARLLRTG